MSTLPDSRIPRSRVTRPTSDDSSPGPVAVIDIGASAVRLVIANTARGKPPEILEQASRGLLIGRDTFSSGRIGAETMEAAVRALLGFRRIIDTYGKESDPITTRTVATSAVREASNADVFIDRVRVRTGLTVEVIDGAEESRLTYLAIREVMSGHRAAKARQAVLLEVGGGSLVVSRLDRLQPRQSGVYPLGAIRLRQSLATWHGRHEQRVALLSRHIANVVVEIGRDMNLAGVTEVIALGSDIRFVANELDESDDDIVTVPREAFLARCEEIIKLDEETLVERYRLAQVSAETLVPALLIYRDLLLQTSATHLVVPDVSLRAGVLAAMAGGAAEPALADYDAQVLASAHALGEKYRYDAPHAEAVARLAVRLFDALAKEHALGRHDRLLLHVAALLHDVGTFLSVRAHHKHTLYILEASEIFGLSKEDMRLAANVARYHRRSLPQPTHASYMALSREDRVRVQKLAGLLRLANALDAEHLQKILGVRLTSRADSWVVHLDGTGDLTMERLVATSRSDLLTQVFGRKVVLQGTGVDAGATV